MATFFGLTTLGLLLALFSLFKNYMYIEELLNDSEIENQDLRTMNEELVEALDKLVTLTLKKDLITNEIIKENQELNSLFQTYQADHFTELLGESHE